MGGMHGLGGVRVRSQCRLRLRRSVSHDSQVVEEILSLFDGEIHEVEPVKPAGKRQRSSSRRPPAKRTKGPATTRRISDDSDIPLTIPVVPEGNPGNNNPGKSRPPVQCPQVPLPEQLQNPDAISDETLQTWKRWFVHATTAERRHLFNSTRMAINEGLQAAFTMLCGANTAMQYKLFKMLMPYGCKLWEGDLAGVLATLIWTHKDHIMRLVIGTSREGEDMRGTMVVDERPPPMPEGFIDRTALAPGQPTTLACFWYSTSFDIRTSTEYQSRTARWRGTGCSRYWPR
jgi:hypothetical protein